MNSRPVVLTRRNGSMAFVVSAKAMSGFCNFNPCTTPPMASGTTSNAMPISESQK